MTENRRKFLTDKKKAEERRQQVEKALNKKDPSIISLNERMMKIMSKNRPLHNNYLARAQLFKKKSKATPFVQRTLHNYGGGFVTGQGNSRQKDFFRTERSLSWKRVKVLSLSNKEKHELKEQRYKMLREDSAHRRTHQRLNQLKQQKPVRRI